MADPGHLRDYKEDMKERHDGTGGYLGAHNGQWRSVAQVLSHHIDPEPSEGELGRGGEAAVASTNHCDRLSYHDDPSATLAISLGQTHIYISTQLCNEL